MERLCYATEFEIEGWKKIVPLIDILNQYTNVPISTRIDLKPENGLKLKMEKFYAISQPDKDGKFKDADFDEKTIKDTEIYRHFVTEKSKQKLAIYVSEKIPVNEEYRSRDYSSAGNHCVIATGIADWNGGECLVLDNTTGSIEDNYIPVDFPIFEALVKKIDEDDNDPLKSAEYKNRSLNKYGFGLAKKKFKNIKFSDFKDDGKDEKWEYQMFFVKGMRPIYKLKFLQS